MNSMATIAEARAYLTAVTRALEIAEELDAEHVPGSEAAIE
jgi:hypothetical protein